MKRKRHLLAFLILMILMTLTSVLASAECKKVLLFELVYIKKDDLMHFPFISMSGSIDSVNNLVQIEAQRKLLIDKTTQDASSNPIIFSKNYLCVKVTKDYYGGRASLSGYTLELRERSDLKREILKIDEKNFVNSPNAILGFSSFKTLLVNIEESNETNCLKVNVVVDGKMENYKLEPGEEKRIDLPQRQVDIKPYKPYYHEVNLPDIMTVEAGLRLINHGYYTLEMREGQ